MHEQPTASVSHEGPGDDCPAKPPPRWFSGLKRPLVVMVLVLGAVWIIDRSYVAHLVREGRASEATVAHRYPLWLLAAGVVIFHGVATYLWSARQAFLAGTVARRTKELAAKNRMLQESEERWNFALEGAGDGVWDWDAATGVVHYSRQWKAMLGYEEHEIGATVDEWSSRVHPDDKTDAMAQLQLHLSGQTPVYVSEHRLRCKDGSYKWILDRGKVMTRTPDGKPQRVIGTHADITDRRVAEETLRESEKRYRDLIELLPDAIFINRDDRIVFVNPAALTLFGVSSAHQVLGRSPFEVFHPDYHSVMASRIRQVRSGHPVPLIEEKIIRHDGSLRSVEVTGAPFTDADGPAILVLLRDVTERQEVLEQSRQQQAAMAHLERVAAVGEMGSGLAHELNQPLAAIINYTGLCLDILDRNPADHPLANLEKLRRAVHATAHEAERAGQIIRRLRSFIRKQRSAPRVLEINEVIRESLELMRPTIRRAQVRIQEDLTANLPKIQADPVQIQQVMVNLVQNAIDAMESLPPVARSLVVRTAPGNSSGDLIRVVVRDAGAGVPPEQREAIFESFVTTKPDGLGLGLPISRSIIESHGGHLVAIANSDGAGMTFEFTLPAI